MGYIPLFLTILGASLLFFLTVKNTLQRKLKLQKELTQALSTLSPELQLEENKLPNPDEILETLKDSQKKQPNLEKALSLVRELKVNRMQYNQLIKKAPYNWVAAIGGFYEI
ncbi:MAG: hypothetical protein HWE15_12045 [Algoriphagus sp.]|uniref:hypothetical protein n=1 Tax=Algoriphagus sp. TaxID=1872435 RepID=UPI00180C46ED|nr:hypothetical protein [Algoriphagus sp.]NVJ87032.1 hypothetical protein [Algoriphagus sp.]